MVEAPFPEPASGGERFFHQQFCLDSETRKILNPTPKGPGEGDWQGGGGQAAILAAEGGDAGQVEGGDGEHVHPAGLWRQPG